MELRNVALAGHGSSGKTSLGEAILYKAKATKRLGQVDSGTSVLDFDDSEISKKISINVKVFTFNYENLQINMIDTPGFIDFSGDMYSGLSVADSIITVVDGTSGVDFVTEKVVEFASQREIPRLFYVSKVDKEEVDYFNVYDEIRSEIGDGVLPLTIPIGSGPEFRGVIDLLSMKAFTESGEGEIPESEKRKVAEYREHPIYAYH